LAAVLFCHAADAQVFTAWSASRQFVARQKQGPMAALPAAGVARIGIAGGWAFLVSSKGSSAVHSGEKVTLDASTLVVSCERLKRLLLMELEMSDQWRGRVDLTINPELTDEQGPLLTGIFRPNGWNYELELPKSLDQEILMRAMVQTLLLEIENRKAGPQSAEVPLWLVEGMSARLRANNLPTFIVQPGEHWSGEIKWNRGAAIMPEELRQHAALTFQQLSWPQPADMTAQALPVYRTCSRLFLEELLRFPDGKACLRSMLAQSAQHWNWQTAFLLAFRSHFSQLLDVEKWWGLNYVDFAKGESSQSWAADDCWTKLKNSLDVPIDVHFDPSHLPVEARLTLQEAIRQWQPADAFRAVQGAIGSLRYLAAHATPELRPLAGLYLKTLSGFLNDSQAAERSPRLGKNATSRLDSIKAGVIKQLDALDRLRSGMRAMRANAVSTNLTQLAR